MSGALSNINMCCLIRTHRGVAGRDVKSSSSSSTPVPPTWASMGGVVTLMLTSHSSMCNGDVLLQLNAGTYNAGVSIGPVTKAASSPSLVQRGSPVWCSNCEWCSG